MAITRLGHVGLYVRDLDRSVAFYRDVLGLRVNDTAPGQMAFLSSQDRVAEHHELVLVPGRTDGRVVQQVSFRVRRCRTCANTTGTCSTGKCRST